MQAAKLVQRAGRLDDRRPARNLVLDQSSKGSLAAPGLVRQHAAKLEQPLARGLVVERLVERFGELVDDRLGRPLGGEQRIPRLRLEFRKARLLAGGNVGQRRAALRGSDRIS